VPKLMAMIVALGLSLPWIIMRMVEYAQHLITNIPSRL
jgi:flagellar biosynthesis protein FliQ